MISLLLLQAAAGDPPRASEVVLRVPVAVKSKCRFAVSPEGNRLLVCNGGTAKLYAVPSSKPLWTRWGRCSAFFPDGKKAATYSPGSVVIRDARTGATMAKLQTRSRMNVPAISPNGRYITTGFGKGGIACWDAVAGRRRWSAPLFSKDWIMDLPAAAFDDGAVCVAYSYVTRGEPMMAGTTVVLYDDMGREVGAEDSWPEFEGVSRLRAVGQTVELLALSQPLQSIVRVSFSLPSLRSRVDAVPHWSDFWVTPKGRVARIGSKLDCADRAGATFSVLLPKCGTRPGPQLLAPELDEYMAVSLDGSTFAYREPGCVSLRRILWPARTKSP